MGNIREKYKVKVTKKEENREKDTKKTSYDVASYPFGAEEMLLNAELKRLDRDER